MKFNKWTLGLAAVGAVSLASAVQAAEQQNPVMTALSSTTISGYVDTSAIYRIGSDGNNGAPSTRWTTPGLFGQLGKSGSAVQQGNVQNKADGFNLDVVKLTIEKPLDESEWAAGYKVDLLFGPDAVGYNPSPNAHPSEVNIKQAYVSLRAPIGNGLTFKMGVFDTVIGYEGFDAANNPHFTRSYGYSIEPFEHTGLLASYKVADFLSFCGGVANTTSSSINARSVGQTTGVDSETEKTYMGGVAITLPESLGFLAGSTLYGGIVNGLGTTRNAYGKATWVYGGATLKTPITGVTLGASYDYAGVEENTSFAGAAARDGVAWTTAGYVGIQASEKLKLNFRGEYAKGSNGTWYTQAATAKNEDRLLALTATVDYSLWANVISRVEFRYDRCLDNLKAAGQNNGPFAATSNNNFILALNVIYKF